MIKIADREVHYDQIKRDIDLLKSQITELQREIAFLKENYHAIGYIIKDSILSDEEKLEIQNIKDVVKKQDFSRFEELT